VNFIEKEIQIVLKQLKKIPMDPYFIFLEENELSNQVLTLREIDILRLI
jgi:hypothetical protein